MARSFDRGRVRGVGSELFVRGAVGSLSAPSSPGNRRFPVIGPIRVESRAVVTALIIGLATTALTCPRSDGLIAR